MDENKKNVNAESKVPTFTPPAPSFTPPKKNVNGPTCYYHNDEPAVTKCTRCGKNLCRDCSNSYGFSSGQYAGQSLCYDCTRQLVAENRAELQKNYDEIKHQYISCGIGCVIGGIIGIVWGISGGIGGALLYGLLCAAIGGSAKTFFSRFFSAVPSFFVSTGNFILSLCVGLAKFMGYFFIYAFKALFETSRKILYYVNYMKQTSGFIDSDTTSLQQLDDYMEYTMIQNQNRGVDFDILLAQKSELANNSYVHLVQEQGQKGAEAIICGCVASINENGEIIRSFREDGKVAA